MLISVSSDRPGFKEVKFRDGFNVILAERTKESTKRDSRNGLGKSTLIEIIHYCLGSDLSETLKKEELEGWTFTLEIFISEKKYKISRNTSEKTAIMVEGDCSSWPIKPSLDRKTGKHIISQSNLNKVLGYFIFGLKTEYRNKYAPTFRSLISYFIRRIGSGGLLEPFKQHSLQKTWDIQVNNSFLLGLDWESASDLQVLKDKGDLLQDMKKAAETGLLSNFIGSIGELQATKVRLEQQVKFDKVNLDTFKVHPQYEQIEDEANKLTQHIHERVNENVSDKNIIEYYEQSLEEETDAKPEAVIKVYEEAGVILPQSILKKLEDVMIFHKKVVANRREFLQHEMQRLKDSVENRQNEIKLLTEKRAEMIKILDEHGALREYTQLSSRYHQLLGQLNEVNTRIENINKIEQGKSALKIDMEKIFQKANLDLNDREEKREKAINLFNLNSQSLYEVYGNLVIDFVKTGYKFDVDIKRSGSQGIDHMKIFCYDLLLAQLWAEQSKGNISLIHDSSLFADVDERQTAIALQLAEKESRTKGFQYICTMNSDNVPTKDFDKDFNFNQYTVLTLTDSKEDGGLLGIRF